MKPLFALRLASVLVLASTLAACFQPVHAPRLGGGGSALQATLSQVSVDRIDGFIGYTLKSELDYLLTGGAPAQGTRFRLKVTIIQDRGSSIIDGATGRALSVTLQAQAVYELTDLRDKKIRASGRTFASAAFDRSQQRFATTRAQRDAEERLGKSLAERMRIIIATALSKEVLPEASPAPSLEPYPLTLDERRSDDPADEN
jgi:LPS-assembly lipoprotein